MSRDKRNSPSSNRVSRLTLFRRLELRARRKFVVSAALLCDAVLANLIEQGFVADLEQRRCLLAVPIRFFERAGNCFGLGFVLSASAPEI